VSFLLAPDLSAPTGGNRYDRELVARGVVRPVADLRQVPDGASVLLDGLITSEHPELLAEHAGRLRLVLLMHLLRADEGGSRLEDEIRSLRLVDAVVVTSHTYARRIDDVAGIRAVVAEPGTDPAAVSPAGGAFRLLSVGTVGPRKGQEIVARAVAALGPPWTLRCAGTVEQGFQFPGTTLLGPVQGAALESEWARADLHVLLSNAEPYGMAVAEGLRRGVPSIVSHAGELPNLVGSAGLSVPRSATVVADVLRTFASSADLRHRWRSAARERTLPTWDDTAAIIREVL